MLIQNDKNLELQHHGILGMKWGVRRYQNEDGTLTAEGRSRYNPDYTEKQRKYDRAVYSKGAERRINRRMNQGYGLKAARSLEAQRIHSARSKASAASAVGGVAGVGLGLFAPELLTMGARALARTGNFPWINSHIHVLKQDNVKMAIRAGAAFVAPMLTSKVARDVTMRVHGYSPNKFHGATGAEAVDTAESLTSIVRR